MNAQPYLFFEGRCKEALEFYKQAISAKVGMLMRYSYLDRGHAAAQVDGVERGLVETGALPLQGMAERIGKLLKHCVAPSSIDVGDAKRVAFDEAPRLDFIARRHRKDAAGFDGVVGLPGTGRAWPRAWPRRCER